MGDKYRMRCMGTSDLWDQFRAGTVLEMPKGCGWRGIRTDQGGCECYDIWRAYCRPLTPGPGCPRGINWSCPRCRGSVTGQQILRLERPGGWHRRNYNVPAFIRRRIEFEGQPGQITGFDGPHLIVRLDGDKHSVRLHPTWHVDYLEPADAHA